MSEAFTKKSVSNVCEWLEDEGVPVKHCTPFEGTVYNLLSMVLKQYISTRF